MFASTVSPLNHPVDMEMASYADFHQAQRLLEVRLISLELPCPEDFPMKENESAQLYIRLYIDYRLFAHLAHLDQRMRMPFVFVKPLPWKSLCYCCAAVTVINNGINNIKMALWL